MREELVADWLKLRVLCRWAADEHGRRESLPRLSRWLLRCRRRALAPAAENPKTLELANALIAERLELQKSGIERVEAKALALMGFAAIALPFLVTRQREGAWMIAALVFYALTFGSGLIAIALYEHQFPPDPGRLVDAYLDVAPEHLLSVLVRERAFAFSLNAQHALRKRVAWLVCVSSLVMAVTLSAVSFWRN